MRKNNTNDGSPPPNEGTKVLKTSVWTNTVHNYIRQKTEEIEDFNSLEIDTLKWCKEHIPRDGNDLTEEGQMLLDDPQLWMDLLTSTFTSTFTGDWFLTEGENQDKLGEWLKTTQFRYQDQRRMVQQLCTDSL